MKLNFIRSTLLIMSFIFSCSAWSANSALVPATSVIKNLDQTLTTIKNDGNKTVVFPTLIPPAKNLKQLFSSSDLTLKAQGFAYIINADATPTCNGAHYCNIGSLTAKTKGEPRMYKDRQDKVITVPVKLANGIQGFFTPGHAMGDYWAPTIEWKNNNMLYSLRWNAKVSGMSEQEMMVAMANSAIQH
jgi:hypothetical protein